MRSRQTAFVVVTTLEPQAFAEAEFFCDKLREYSMPLRAVVVNRVLDESLLDPDAVAAATAMVDDTGIAAWMRHVTAATVPADLPRRVGEAFLALNSLARHQAAQVDRLSRLGNVPVARLPLAEHDVHDIDGLVQMAAHLRGRSAG